MIQKVLPLICALVAAGVLGNWYLSEYRRVRATPLPWYRAYLTLPGILILVLFILLPVLAKYIKT